MHRAIARRTFKAIGPAALPARVAHDGISESVYGGLRAAGAGVAALARAGLRAAARDRDLPRVSASARGSLAIGAINGIIGDELEETGSDIRIELALRHLRRDLPAEPAALAAAYPAATGKVVLFVHGLMETDESWRLRERVLRETYGSRLASDLGYTPLFLRYNTGLEIAENGRRLAGLLESLMGAWAVSIDELVLIGHSMGGLVARSACDEGIAGRHAWTEALRHVVCLGTPHGGAPLEKAANVGARTLGIAPESKPFANILNTRSAGIKDLRLGSDAPLADGVAHHFVAATLSAQASHPVGVALGDMLVRVGSASGRNIALAQADLRHFGGVNHIELLNHPLVYEQLRDWLDV
jgi:pimeloyl-ACP methyl ester carboxylesterase